ncbi:MAG TPA: BamA/TamA family outer membrane protein, partial [Candidatus Manganitrophaceae bacterium]|nr:BamA/TamA family outer membrane protein [Candidatus Manganitrophaceae bacterium]
VLLREITLKMGDPYNPEKILNSQKQLYRTGHFTVVQFEPIPSEADPTVQDLQLTVVERPSIALEFGFGYADLERLGGFFEVAHRNLFGTGRAIVARAQADHIEKRYTLNYKEPWIFSQHIDARLVAAYLDLKEPAFDQRTVSFTAGVDKSFSDTLKGSFLYQFEVNNLTNVDPAALQTPQDIGRVQIASLNPSIIRDTRDDPFNPRAGSVNSITIRDAAQILGSEAQFVKVTAQSSWYQALSSKWVLAVSARAGIAERFGQTQIIPLSERFFVGGRSTVRGYAQDKLGIRGVTLSNDGQPTGGNTMLVFNEELRIALPKSLGLVLFFDHGNVWQRYQDIAFSDIKSTTGIGFRYNTPVGPFRIDWGYKLNREEGESPSEVHFTLGHAF